jgi:hypothetical protein
MLSLQACAIKLLMIVINLASNKAIPFVTRVIFTLVNICCKAKSIPLECNLLGAPFG